MDRVGARAPERVAERRFHAGTLPARGEAVALDAEAQKHARVLRLKDGDPVELFDGRGGRVPARLTGKPGRLQARAEGEPAHTPRSRHVHLVQCASKGSKLDDIVRAATELGVAAIHVALSERSVARPGAERSGKLGRWERIAVEAARQSEQAWVPALWAPAPLAEVLDRAGPQDQKLALTERDGAPLAPLIPGAPVWLVVGPEGGLSAADRALLTRSGFRGVGLGNTILRVETAAVLGVGLVMDRLGALRGASAG